MSPDKNHSLEVQSLYLALDFVSLKETFQKFV